MLRGTKSNYYFAQDVAEMMEISTRKAYDIIRELNEELKAMGKTAIIPGRINKSYYHYRVDVDIEDIKQREMRVTSRR